MINYILATMNSGCEQYDCIHTYFFGPTLLYLPMANAEKQTEQVDPPVLGYINLSEHLSW